MKSSWFVLLVLVWVVSGCSMMPEKPAQEYRLSAMRVLQNQPRWQLEGRLAVVNERDSVSAAIVWRHEPDSEQIELSGPLSQGRTQISIAPQAVVVDQGGGKQVYVGEADEVFARQLNVEMPVTALRFWVLGVNDPAMPFIEIQGGFIQDGWTVLIKEMQRLESTWLPKKIAIEKNKTKIKLIVDQWVML